MAKFKGLGRGLDALLANDPPPAAATALHALPVDRIQPGKYQPRTRMDEGSLTQLAESIKARGVMQPIMVRPIDKDRYEIIAGERRWRAATRAGLSEVPVIVREVEDQAALALSLIENIQREDLNALEEAQGIKRLVEEFGLTHDSAAQAVGRSRSAVTNLLRLTQLAKPVQELLLAGSLEMGHARALLSLAPDAQVLAAGRIVAQELSVRDAERMVQGLSRAKERPGADKPGKSKSADVERLEQDLADRLGAKVRIEPKRRGAGRLVIDYSSLDQLDGILARLR